MTFYDFSVSTLVRNLNREERQRRRERDIAYRMVGVSSWVLMLFSALTGLVLGALTVIG